MTTGSTKRQDGFTDEAREALLLVRHDLHQHPELAFHEERTAQKLYEALERLKPARLDRVAGTGVVARICGRDPHAPTVALRGDIDALPIQENTGLPFSSRHPGIMHACGHDVHATWTLGAAQLLADQPADGDVVILFQPAEETGKGATAMIEAGALEGVQAVFGAHVDRRFRVGEVVADAGPLAASADTFSIELIGSGGHGARPHEGADPIVGAAAVVTALQTIVSRLVNPATAAVVTVGTLQAGTASNIIPDRAFLTGTLRAIDPDTRRTLHDSVQTIAKAIAEAHGLTANVEVAVGTPPIVNPEEPVGWARTAVTTLLGSDALKPLGTLNMGGEDFAFYLEEIPGCFLRVGARESGGEIIPAHNPHFYASDECVPVGAAVLAETARVASAALRGRRNR
ncbi:MAG: M20 family metallopeptidase [Gemmatimonadetes bacterium]|nr:M20 family metallopeptidase [Gemmatimonadota bacterium]